MPLSEGNWMLSFLMVCYPIGVLIFYLNSRNIARCLNLLIILNNVVMIKMFWKWYCQRSICQERGQFRNWNWYQFQFQFLEQELKRNWEKKKLELELEWVSWNSRNWFKSFFIPSIHFNFLDTFFIILATTKWIWPQTLWTQVASTLHAFMYGIYKKGLSITWVLLVFVLPILISFLGLMMDFSKDC